MFNDYLNVFIDKDYPKFIDKYLKTKTLERIKSVGQFCGCDYTKLYNIKFFYSRFQHSLVVAHMTWHFTHDKKETIAALLHDVGTPAFAHTVDYVFDDYENQETSEKSICDIIKKDKKLVRCLESDNITLSDLEDLSVYQILENKAPKLCTDRLDGVLGTSYIWLQKSSLEEIKKVYDNIMVLINEDGNYELGFNNIDIALSFVKMVYNYAMELQGNKDKFVMKYIADVVKLIVDKGFITINDLYNSKEEDIVKLFEENVESWKTFSEATNIMGSDDEPKCYYVAVNAKKRNVIPLVNVGSEVKRIDKISLEAQKLYDNYFKFQDKMYAFMKDIEVVK